MTVLVATGCAGATSNPDATSKPGQSPSSSSPGTPGQRQLLVSYQRTGGIAGFDDRLSVWTDGSYTVASRHASGGTGMLSPAELAELRRVLESTPFASLPPKGSPPPIADGFQHHIVYATVDLRVWDGAIPQPLEPVIAALGTILRTHGGT